MLHASNGYAAYLLPHTRIVPVRGQILALRASHWAWNAGPRWGWGWVTNGGNEYWLTRGENEGRLVLIGGGREVSQSDPPFETYITDDGKKNELVGRFLREYLDRIFPVSSARVNSSDSEVAWEWVSGPTSSRCMRSVY